MRVQAPAENGSLAGYARVAGLAYLIIIAAGIFAEFFVRGSLIVPGDAAATAGNIARIRIGDVLLLLAIPFLSGAIFAARIDAQAECPFLTCSPQPYGGPACYLDPIWWCVIEQYQGFVTVKYGQCTAYICFYGVRDIDGQCSTYCPKDRQICFAS